MLLSTESFSCKQKGLLLQVLTAWYIRVLTCVTQHFLNKGNFEGQSICFTVARLGQLLLRAQKKAVLRFPQTRAFTLSGNMRADTGYFPNQITLSKYAGACNFEKLSSLFIVSSNYKKAMTHSFFQCRCWSGYFSLWLTQGLWNKLRSFFIRQSSTVPAPLHFKL